MLFRSVGALLTPGEFVVNKAATKAFLPLLNSINDSKYPESLSLGNKTPIVANTDQKFIKNNNTAVYNYSLSVTAGGSNANPDDIARTVIAQIRNMDSQRLRGGRY